MKIVDELQSSTLRSSIQYTGTLGVRPRPEKKNGARQLKLSLSLLTSCRLLYIDVCKDTLFEKTGWQNDQVRHVLARPAQYLL